MYGAVKPKDRVLHQFTKDIKPDLPGAIEKPQTRESRLEKEAQLDNLFQGLTNTINARFHKIREETESFCVDCSDEIKNQVDNLFALIDLDSKEDFKKQMVTPAYNSLIKKNIDLSLNSEINQEIYAYFIKKLRTFKQNINQKLLVLQEVKILIEKESIKQGIYTSNNIINIINFSKNVKNDLDYASSRFSKTKRKGYYQGYSVDTPDPASLLVKNIVTYDRLSVALVNGQRENPRTKIDLDIGSKAEVELAKEISAIEGVIMAISFPSNLELDILLKTDVMTFCSDQDIEPTKKEELANLILTISNYSQIKSQMKFDPIIPVAENDPEQEAQLKVLREDPLRLNNVYREKRSYEIAKNDKNNRPRVKITEGKDYKKALEVLEELKNIHKKSYDEKIKKLEKENKELIEILEINKGKLKKQKIIKLKVNEIVAIRVKIIELETRIAENKKNIIKNIEIIENENKEILEVRAEIKKIEAIEKGVDPENIALPTAISPYFDTTVIYQDGKALETEQKQGVDQMIKFVEEQEVNNQGYQFLDKLIREFNRLIIESNIRVVPLQIKNSLHYANRDKLQIKVDKDYKKTEQNIAGIIAYNEGRDDQDKRKIELEEFLGI